MPSARALRFGKAVIELGLTGGPQIDAQLKRLERKMRDFGTALKSIGSQALGLGAAFAAPLAAVVNIAANAQEQLAKFSSVFGDQTAAADEFAKSLAKGIGRSVQDIRAALATFQSFNVGLGFGAGQAREMSQQMEQLALDFAAFHNIEDDDATGRFIAAMSGSSEVLDQFGVNIKQAAIEQELLAMGINKTAQDASEQEKVMARLNIIMNGMGQQGAIGAAARESNSFANRLKALKGEVKDVAAEIGVGLLPAVTEMLGSVKGLVSTVGKWLSQNPAIVKGIGLVTAAIVGAGGLAYALGLLAANPVVVGIGLVAGSIALLANELSKAKETAKGLRRIMLKLTGQGHIVDSEAVMASGVPKIALPKGINIDPAKIAAANGIFPDTLAGIGGRLGGAASGAMGGLFKQAKDAATIAGIQAQTAIMQMQFDGERQRAQIDEARALDEQIAREKIGQIEDQDKREKALIEHERLLMIQRAREAGTLTPEVLEKINQLAAAQVAGIKAVDQPAGGAAVIDRAVFDTRRVMGNFFKVGAGDKEDVKFLKKIAANTDPAKNGGIPVL